MVPFPTVKTLWYSVDVLAVKQLPWDDYEGLVPALVPDDRNCLFHAIPRVLEANGASRQYLACTSNFECTDSL